MYAKNGTFYIDVDERHEFLNLMLLIFALVLILGSRKAIVELTNEYLEKEYSMTIGMLYYLPELFKKKEEDK
jgi:hypothetical protein